MTGMSGKTAKITLLLSLTAFAASVYSLAAAAAYAPALPPRPLPAVMSDTDMPPRPADVVTPSDTSAPPFRTKLLRLYRGRIAVFEEDGTTPIRLLSTDVTQLPSDAVKRLRDGVYAYTADQYRNYLEDFS
ncbi:MAG: hypothetical protein IIU00_04010 [Clostridia bacterium]|nr:hypothetical protein [Clostridia bacterium]